jgi:hypothetical protein
VILDPGRTRVEWFNIDRRESVSGHVITVETSGSTSFKPSPEGSGPTVPYLKRVDG